MADDENKNENEQNQDQPEAEEKAPEAAPEQAPDEGSPEVPPAEEAPADEPAEEAPAAEAAAEEPPAEEAAAAEEGDDELEGLDWKARRRLLRSRESGEAGPQQSPEQRTAQREERRRAAARRRSSYRRKRRERRQPGEGTPPSDRASVDRKVRQGTVVSSKADKTITVRVDIVRRHPAYEKIVRRSNTLQAHDERNEAGEGDLVRLVETRPISRTKRWRLTEILEKAK
jgi:small subunit ribosomal protein S17